MAIFGIDMLDFWGLHKVLLGISSPRILASLEVRFGQTPVGLLFGDGFVEFFLVVGYRSRDSCQGHCSFCMFNLIKDMKLRSNMDICFFWELELQA